MQNSLITINLWCNKTQKICFLGFWVVSLLPEAMPKEMSLWWYFGPSYKWQHVALWWCGVVTPQTKKWQSNNAQMLWWCWVIMWQTQKMKWCPDVVCRVQQWLLSWQLSNHCCPSTAVAVWKGNGCPSRQLFVWKGNGGWWQLLFSGDSFFLNETYHSQNGYSQDVVVAAG